MSGVINVCVINVVQSQFCINNLGKALICDWCDFESTLPLQHLATIIGCVGRLQFLRLWCRTHNGWCPNQTILLLGHSVRFQLQFNGIFYFSKSEIFVRNGQSCQKLSKLSEIVKVVRYFHLGQKIVKKDVKKRDKKWIFFKWGEKMRKQVEKKVKKSFVWKLCRRKK